MQIFMLKDMTIFAKTTENRLRKINRNMKKLLCIYYLLCIATLAYAQDLRFNANGKFKIVQFTDVHYILMIRAQK